MLIRLHYCLKFIVVNFTIIMVAAYLDNACTCFILEYIIQTEFKYKTMYT